MPAAPIPAPIPVICDRCREQGRSDEDPFAAFGALLDFDPVPRRTDRADGWTPDVQRAFVAALSLTGSVRAACRAVGKAQFGVNQLYASFGSEGFRAACEEAMEIAADERGRRLAEGLRAVAAEKTGWTPPEPPWAKAAKRGRPTSDERRAAAATANAATAAAGGCPPPGGPRDDEGYTAEDRYKLEGLQAVIEHYMQRIGMERQARLEGKIVEADFYVRQVTFLEISIHLLNGGSGREAMRYFQNLRHGTHRSVDIAQTVISEMLDDARRAKWAELGEPLRPPPLRPDQMIDAGEIKLLRSESHIAAGPDVDERLRAREEALARAAQEQIIGRRRRSSKARPGAPGSRRRRRPSRPRAGPHQSRTLMGTQQRKERGAILSSERRRGHPSKYYFDGTPRSAPPASARAFLPSPTWGEGGAHCAAMGG